MGRAQGTVKDHFTAVLGNRRGLRPGQESSTASSPVKLVDEDELADEVPATGEPDLGFVRRKVSAQLEKEIESGDLLLWHNYSHSRRLDDPTPMQHFYVEARYTQKGELVATATYNEHTLGSSIELPKRVLYRGKSLTDLVKKLDGVRAQLASQSDPIELNTREKGYQECSVPKLTRKIARIAGERKRLLATGLTI